MDAQYRVLLTAEGHVAQVAATEGAALEKYSSKVKDHSSEWSKLGDQIGSSMRFIAASLGLAGAIAGLTSLAKGAFDFNSQMENSRLGIAGMISTFQNLNGAMVPFARASQEAEAAQEGLRIAALQTAAQFTDLVRIYETVFPAAVQAGFKTDQVVAFTKTMTQLADAMHIGYDVVAQEISLVLQGVVRAEGRIGLMFKSMGVTSEVIASWKAQGIAFDEIMKRMKGMSDLAPEVAKTWSAAWSNMKDAIQQLLGSGTSSVFEAAKRSVLAFTSSLVTISGDKIVFSPELLNRVRAISDAFAQIVGHMGPLAAAFVNFGSAAVVALANVASYGGPILDALAGILNAVSPLIERFGEWAIVVGGVTKAMVALSVVQFGTSLKELGTALSLLGGAKTASDALAGLQLTGAAAGAALAPLAPVLAGLAAALVILTPFLAEWSMETDKADEATKRAVQSTQDLANHILLAKGVYMSTTEVTKFSTLSLKDQGAIIALMKGGVLDLAGAMAKLNEQLESNARTTDPKTLQQLDAQILKLTEDTKALSLTGFAAAYAREAGAFKEAQAKLQVEMKTALPDQQAKLLELQAVQEKEHSAKLAVIGRDVITQKRQLAAEGQKADEELYQAGFDGMAKELAALTVHEANVRRISLEKIAKAKTDSVTYASVIATEGKVVQDQLEADAIKRVEIVRKGLEEWRALAISSTVSILRDQGNEVEAQMTEVREKYRIELDKLAKQAEELTKLNPLGFLAMTPEQMTALAALGKTFSKVREAMGADLTKIQHDNALATAGMRKDWESLWDDIERRIQKGVITVKEGMDEQAANLLRWGATTAEGIEAGWLKVSASIQSNTQIAATYVIDTWQTMKQGFDDIIVGGITKGWSGLLGALKTASDGYLKNFTKMVTDMVATWIAGQSRMKVAGATGGGGGAGSGEAYYGEMGYGPGGVGVPSLGTGTTSVPTNYSGAVAGGLGAAAAGFGGATGGAQAFGAGFAPYLSAAAMAITIAAAIAAAATTAAIAAGATVVAAAAGSAVIPVVGWIVAAVLLVVGLIINLLAKDTEQMYRVTAANLKLYASGDFKGGTDSTSKLMASSGGGQAIIDWRDKIVGSLFDVIKLGAPTDAAKWTKEINARISKYLLGINFEVHAGSDEDIQKDFKNLFEQIMPQEMMGLLFGMGRDPRGRNIAGISGGLALTSGTLDETAPITAFLLKLGLTITYVKQLADESQTTDPTVFMARLKALVTLIVGWNQAQLDMAKSYDQVVAEISGTRGKSVADTFKENYAAIIDEANSLDAFSGDVKIKKSQEVVDAIQKQYAAELQYIGQIMDAIDTAKAQVQALHQQMGDALKNPEWLAADQQRSLVQYRWTPTMLPTDIQTAGSPAEAKKAYDTAVAEITNLFNGLVGRLHQLEQIQQNLRDLQAAFTGSAKDLAAEAQKGPLWLAADQLGAMGAAAIEVAHTTGQAQVDALGRVQNAASSLLSTLTAEANAVAANLKALHASIQQQIWENTFSTLGNQKDLDTLHAKIVSLTSELNSATDPTKRAELQGQIDTTTAQANAMDPKQQIDAIQARIASLTAELAHSTSAADTERITGEISGLWARYLQYFDPNDLRPEAVQRRNEAIAFTNAGLTALQNAADAAYARINATIQSQMDAANAILTGAITSAGGAITQIGLDIAGLGALLDEVEREYQAALEAFGAAVVAASNAAGQALQDAATAARTVSGTLAGDNSLESAANDARDALGRFKNKLDDFGGGGLLPVTTGPPPPTSSIRVSPSTLAVRSVRQAGR